MDVRSPRGGRAQRPARAPAGRARTRGPRVPMSDLQTAMACATLLGAAGLFWDGWEGSPRRGIDSALAGDVEKRLDKDIATLRDPFVAELAAMKSEFDKIKARDAIAAFNDPRGAHARQYSGPS